MKKLYSLLLLTFIGILSSYGQTVDDTFVQPIAYKAAKITVTKELPGGKILLGGDIAFYGNTPVHNLIRLNADYSLDETFLFANPNNLKIKKAELQSSGNIIVLANVDNPWGSPGEQTTIFQLNSNGELITSITSLTDVSSITVQADDKILVSLGHWAVDNGNLYRYNTDLTLDDSFNNVITFDKKVSDIKVFGNSIYVSGMFSVVDGITRNSIIKLNNEGSIDSSFDVGVGANGRDFSLTIQDDGKLLVGGNFLKMVDNTATYNMARLNSDGSFDTSFSSQYYNYANSVVGIKDSFLYIDTVVNDGVSANNYLVRLKSDGSLDEEFNKIKLNEFGFDNFVLSFIDNKILYNNSEYTGNRYGLSTSDLNGNNIDSPNLKPNRAGSFETGGYFNGKLIVKGDFVKINDVETFGIGMLDETGTVDESFVFKNYLGDIRQFQIIDNSTIFVSTKDLFLKLDNQGNITKNFDYKADSQLLRIEQFKVLESGKILITDQWGLFLLNENGVQESVYTINSSPDYWITGISFEMQDDKILCHSILNSFTGIYTPKLIRFNLDTSIDTSFNIGQGPDAGISKIVVLNSGEIITAGGFSSFNGISIPNQIVKLSKDGEMDLQFNQNLSLYQIGYAQSHDYRKIEEIDSVLYITEGDSKVTAINLDGTLVNNFAMPVTIDQVTDLVASEEPVAENSETSKKSKSQSDSNTSSDTKYMYAFGKVNNPSNGISSVIVKVNLGKKSGSLGLDPVTAEKSISNVQIFPVPVQEKMSLSFSNAVVPTKVAVYSSNGKELYSSKIQSGENIDVDMSRFTPGVYFIKVFSDSGVTTKKIIKK
ncbi:T9SS type A sorting domain-containing protein [Flavobacterium sp. UBA7680]|uniref:T9SS type A sorting domain-containing protein n=1 Tax=Flavobacterium sp. UBA7680 TaxID=1946559 RepID=UPI0025C31D9A|nr:T9SS type A sorting domain-containing protein [Flavobacterium sp. UBA7680]